MLRVKQKSIRFQPTSQSQSQVLADDDPVRREFREQLGPLTFGRHITLLLLVTS